MADWKRYFNNDFTGCRLLANAHDHCRNREVRIYLIPGEWDDVGVTDGTDRWIAPVAAEPFSVGLRKIIAGIQAGDVVPVVSRNGPRARLNVKVVPEPPPAPRVRLKTPDSTLAPKGPRRVLLT